MALTEVKVPDIGGFKDVAIIEVLVKAGDAVKAEQSLITVESDKASMEIPSPAAGVVKEMKVKLGDRINEGSLILLLETEGAAAAPAAPPASASAPVAAAPQQQPPAAPAPAPAAAGGTMEVKVPDIGGFKDVAIIEVLVKAGDAVQAEQSLITVESDKASMEIPSPAAGVVKEMKVKLGDRINEGSTILLLEVAAGAAAAPSPASAPAAAPAPAASSVAPAAVPAAASTALPAHAPATANAAELPYASPSVRKYARELGVPLGKVTGTGIKGRITQEDVQKFVQGVMAGSISTGAAASIGGGAGLDLLPWPKVDFEKFGPVERRELLRIKKISAANLHRNWVMIPHVTNDDVADITELEALRVRLNRENEKTGTKVTMLAFVIKACVAALKKFPDFNSSLDGDQLVLKKYWNIGFAADTPNGLVVPVLKDADRKGILDISQELAALSKKARDGKLGPAEMTGATFTISSLGGIGGTNFSPIINAPEVAILGLSRSSIQPVWDGSVFQPRLMLPLSLSYDHRVIDGAAAARFNAYLAQVLADFRRVLL